MSDLQVMLGMLASDTEFTEFEMQHMRQRIDLNDASVRSQHRDIDNVHLRPKLHIYERTLDLTVNELARRERNRGRRPPESEAMRARRLRTDDDLDAYASDGKG